MGSINQQGPGLSPTGFQSSVGAVPANPAGPYVRQTWVNATGNSTTPLAVATAVQKGSGIVVFASGQSGHTATIKDTAGNLYRVLPVVSNGGGSNTFYSWYCPYSAGANPTVTVTVTGSSYEAISVLEIVGANPDFFIDARSSTSASSGTQRTFLATTVPGDLIITATSCGNGATAFSTPPSGYSLLSGAIVPATGSLFVASANAPVGIQSGFITWTPHGASNFAISAIAIRAANVDGIGSLIRNTGPGVQPSFFDQFTYLALDKTPQAAPTESDAVGSITEDADTVAGVGTDESDGIAAAVEGSDAVAGIGSDESDGISALLEGADIVAGVGTGSGVSAVTTPTETPAGRSKRIRYVLRLDGQEFTCRSLPEALRILEEAKALAKKLSAERVREATQAKGTKPLAVPKIVAASPDLKGAVQEAQAKIEQIYRSANLDIEIALWFAAEKEREDEDISLLFLM